MLWCLGVTMPLRSRLEVLQVLGMFWNVFRVVRMGLWCLGSVQNALSVSGDSFAVRCLFWIWPPLAAHFVELRHLLVRLAARLRRPRGSLRRRRSLTSREPTAVKAGEKAASGFVSHCLHPFKRLIYSVRSPYSSTGRKQKQMQTTEHQDGRKSRSLIHQEREPSVRIVSSNRYV